MYGGKKIKIKKNWIRGPNPPRLSSTRELSGTGYTSWNFLWVENINSTDEKLWIMRVNPTCPTHFNSSNLISLWRCFCVLLCTWSFSWVGVLLAAVHWRCVLYLVLVCWLIWLVEFLLFSWLAVHSPPRCLSFTVAGGEAVGVVACGNILFTGGYIALSFLGFFFFFFFLWLWIGVECVCFLYFCFVLFVFWLCFRLFFFFAESLERFLNNREKKKLYLFLKKIEN